MKSFKDFANDTNEAVVPDKDIQVKGLTGKVKEMIEWMESQKGWSHSTMFEKGTEFEIFFENSKQALKVVRMQNDKYGYYTKECGNNGRIVEIILNDAGLNEDAKTASALIGAIKATLGTLETQIEKEDSKGSANSFKSVEQIMKDLKKHL